MNLAPGTKLLHYTLDRAIGAGGMSVVWGARDDRSGQTLALKILINREQMALGSRRRFLREAYATRSVDHPAIVPVVDIAETEELVILAMELLSGETLRARFERAPGLSPEQAALTLLPIVEALNLAHAAGIVHRDLKPENIFLQATPAGIRPRLLDFGIARFYEPPPDAGRTPITGFGTLLGTIPYMAPEQAISPSDCDHLVDAWALGVILYEALSGCRPIEGNSPPETLRQLLLGGIAPLSVLVPTLPTEISDLVMGLLTRDRSERTTSRAAAEQLARYLPRGG
ncbi:MAG TPA: serine/threonine-protein kinase [Polyangiaceae bacterium]|nr:serine/threonine-protein kinase [Polyangiaceae bacterium]